MNANLHGDPELSSLIDGGSLHVATTVMVGGENNALEFPGRYILQWLEHPDKGRREQSFQRVVTLMAIVSLVENLECVK